VRKRRIDGTGKTAVVTGAGRGLGAIIVRQLQDVGFDVVGTDLEGADHVLDVADALACRTLAEAVQPSVWVNNAGVLGAGDCATQPDVLVEQIVRVNLLGVINGSRAAAEVMRHRAAGRGDGHIINIGSLASWVPVPGEAVYAATKAGVLSFTLGLDGDLKAAGVDGIRTSVVCPDGMLTPMITEVIDDPAVALTFTGVRLVQPQTVARAVVAVLASHRQVVSVPHWRGAQVRVFGAVPDLVLQAAPLFTRLGRIQQDRVRRRLGR